MAELLSHLHSVQIDSAVHPPSYPTSIVGGHNVNLATYLHRMLMLRKHHTLPPCRYDVMFIKVHGRLYLTLYNVQIGLTYLGIYVL
jgi:hypothetical protein